MNSETEFCPSMNINNYIILTVDYSETSRLSSHNLCCRCSTLCILLAI